MYENYKSGQSKYGNELARILDEECQVKNQKEVKTMLKGKPWKTTKMLSMEAKAKLMQDDLMGDKWFKKPKGITNIEFFEN